VTLIPWLNIMIIASCCSVLVMARMMWLQFRERMVDPAIDRIDAEADAAAAGARGVWGRFTRWLDTWRGKPRK
jgi:hypothetical protein